MFDGARDAAGLIHLAIVRGGDAPALADGRSADADATTAEARSRRIPVLMSERSALSATGPPVRG